MINKVPDIYIVGAQKSGTTTLFDWMAQHPDIHADLMGKDYPYFSNERTHREDQKIFSSFSKKAGENQVVLGGEANAMYAVAGPQRMYDAMPAVHLIVILRSPAYRAFSAHCYAVERLMEDRSLKQAVDDELSGLKRYNVEEALQLDYIAHGEYASQLNNIYQYFNPSQVKVVIFEELIQTPLKIMGEIFQFVGVADDFIPQIAVKNRTAGGYRSKFIAGIIHGRPSSGIVRTLGRALIPYSLRTGFRRKLVNINRVSSSKPEFDEEVLQLLIEYYRDSVVELQFLLSRDILIWSEYDAG